MGERTQMDKTSAKTTIKINDKRSFEEFFKMGRPPPYFQEF